MAFAIVAVPVKKRERATTWHLRQRWLTAIH
jgi:hypothetical protein